MPIQPGERIGEYRLIRPIGEGELSEVWLASGPKGGERIALKILHAEKADPRYLKRLKREFELLSILHHPYLARVFNFGYPPDAERYFFASEYCPGSHLFEAIRDKPQSYFEEILVQILSVLDYIHSEGVIHFDIKAENVLVEEKEGHPQIKLVDFGLAARLQALPQGRPGTLAYVAPEILVHSPSVDHRVDLYSLGMLCLRALTGKWPFDIDNVEEIGKWHLRGIVPETLWESCKISRYLKEIVLKLLEKKASDRFSHARVILNFLNLATDRKYAAAEERLRSQVPTEGPLVQRGQILERLQREFQKVIFASGDPVESSVFFITGEAGIGKSRLLKELRRSIELQEVPVFNYICSSKDATWSQLATRLGLEEKATWISSDSSAATMSFDELPSRDWLTLRRVDELVTLAKHSPLCLLVDDYHQADDEMRSLIAHLQERTQREWQEGGGVPLFVLVASEEGEGPSLPRLDYEGVFLYSHLVLGEMEGVSKVAKILFQYSGGLPLLMVEGLRYLAPYFYEKKVLEDIALPSEVAGLYREKIEKLNSEERELLCVVALLERPVGEEELAMIVDRPAHELALLSKRPLQWGLMKNRFAQEGSTVDYQVSSQALCLDLVHALAPEKLRSLHAKIALGLEKFGKASPEEVADHLAGGGQDKEARRFYEEAAMQLRGRGEISHAAQCLIRALGLCDKNSPIWENLALEGVQLLILSGSYQEAERLLRELKDFPSYRREEEKGWLALKQRRFTNARKSYRLALRLLPEGQTLRKVLLKNALADAELQVGDYEKAASLFRESLDLEETLSLAECVAVNNNNLGLALSLQGKFDEAVRFFQERLQRYGPEQVVERVGCLNAMGYVLVEASRFEKAITSLREALDLAEQSGTFHGLFPVMGNLLTALLKESRYTESLALLKKIVSYQERLGTTHDLSFNWLRRGSVYLTLGMEEAAQSCFQKGKALAVEIRDKLLLAWFLLMEGYWEKEFGSVDAAEKYFHKTEKEAKYLHNDELVGWAVYALSDLACESDNENVDVKECEELLSHIETLPHDEEFLTRLELLHAKLALLQQEVPSLDSAFSPLETRCQKGGFRELLWEVYYSWGRFEWMQGRRKQALSLFEKGVKVVHGISLLLPEEYRDRYLKQRSRRKLHEGWQRALQGHDILTRPVPHA